MAYSDKVLDHYNNPRNVGSLDKNASDVGTGMVGAPECGDVMKLQIKVNDAIGHHRRSQIQDLRLRQRHRQLIARHRMAQGQDRRRSPRHQEHRHRQRTQPAAREDPLLGARRRCDQGRDRRLPGQADRKKRPGGADGGLSKWTATIPPPRFRSRPRRSKRSARRSRRWASPPIRRRPASRRAGRRMFGTELSVQVRRQAASQRQGLRIRRRADFCRPRRASSICTA